MVDKMVYLLNFSGPNFLARFATFFFELKAKGIQTLDFQYQAHMGFGSGLLYLEAPAERQQDVLKYAEELDWKSSFVSSSLPAFYREQNEGNHPDVRFLLLDDEYEDVLEILEEQYSAERYNASDGTYRLKLNTDQVWHFVCARAPDEARRKLVAPSAKRCDILLLDMKLNLDGGTGHDGVRFFDELRAVDRQLPTVVITQGRPSAGGFGGAWDKEIIQEYWRSGAWNFLYKSELHPRLSEIVDLMVDRHTEPLVIVVTSNNLSADLAYLFDFLRNESVKVVRVSCAPGFSELMGAGRPGQKRLVVECGKHQSLLTTDLQNRFRVHVGALRETSVHQEFRAKVDDWVRFHHGQIYEAMSLR